MKTIWWNRAQQVTGLGVALALVAITVGVATTASLAGAAESASLPFDLTMPQSCGMQLKTNNETAANLDMVRDLGCKVIRRGFYWGSIEKKVGVYDFTAYDRLMNNCRDRGLAVIGVMFGGNQLYGGTVLDDKGREGYAKFGAALAEHYKDYNVMWEIWNEPNTMTFWGKHGGKGNTEQYANEYFALVSVTAPAMHKANPKCFVVAGSMSAFWDQSFNWMGFCFQKGILQSGIDAWSVHPYGTKNPEDYIDWYVKMRAMMVKAGVPATFPVLNTERGYPIGKAEGEAGGDPKLSNEYQAWHIVRQYLIDLLCDIKVTVWYEWSGTEGFSLIQGTEKVPAYNAAKFMIEQLSGYRLDKRLLTASPRDFVLHFTNKAGGVKLVAWTSPPAGESPDKIVAHPVAIPVETTRNLDTFQLYGEKGTSAVKDGTITLTLTGAPQYVTVGVATTASLAGAVESASAPQVTSVVQLDKLTEGKTDWKVGNWAGDCQVQLETVKNYPAPGQTSLKYSADITGGGSYCALAKDDLQDLNLAVIIAFRMRVKSDNVTSIGCQLIDDTGQCHQIKNISVTADDKWHDLVIEPKKIAGGEHWGGANDGKWHAPAAGIHIMLGYGSAPNHKPVFYLTDIRADAVALPDGHPVAGPAGTSGAKPQQPKTVVAQSVGQDWWQKRHEQYLKEAKENPVDVIFLGDSITDWWHAAGQPVFDECYKPLHTLNLGISGDGTPHVLWRLENGEVDGLHPKAVVLMIGTNNLGDKSENVTAGVAAVVKKLREKLPDAKVLLLGIFPRGIRPTDWPRADLQVVNEQIAKLNDGKYIKYLDIGQAFLEPDGSIAKTVMGDALHPTAYGYYLWAKAMNPTLETMLGENIAKPTPASPPAH